MNISASPVPAVLSGTEYLIKPLSDQSLQNLTMWCRSNFLRSIHESLRPEMATEEREEILNNANKFSLTVEWDSENGLKLLYETDGGLARLLYESIIPTAPQTTYIKCLGLIKNTDNIDPFLTSYKLANDLTEPVDDKKKANTPRGQKPATTPTDS